MYAQLRYLHTSWIVYLHCFIIVGVSSSMQILKTVYYLHLPVNV